jgi:hypothetical protein
MKVFIYYNKLDPSKESYGMFEAIDLEDAILIASYIKQMTIDDFLNIFVVEEKK